MNLASGHRYMLGSPIINVGQSAGNLNNLEGSSETTRDAPEIGEDMLVALQLVALPWRRYSPADNY